MNSLFFLASLLEINSYAYEPLKDQEWLACNSANFNAEINNNSFIVNYKICFQDEGVPSKEELITITQKIFEFAKKNNLSDNQCVILENLEIYKISTMMLNDKSRFPGWSNKEAKEIWGLYDPRVDETGVSSIMLTEHGSRWNKITLAHELSHYWYDRFCWNQGWSKSDEQFALDFELYLSK